MAEDYEPYWLTEKQVQKEEELQAALMQFTKLFSEEKNDTAAVMVGAAFLDLMLENLLYNFLLEDDKEVGAVLKSDRMLGTYASRVSMAYCLGLIRDIIRDDLRTVGKIRNRFAHDFSMSFEDEGVKSLCQSLKWHEQFMRMKAPADATAAMIFQVGVNTLISHLSGLVGLARHHKCKRIYN